MPRIIRNAIRCEKCGDIIESKTIHDFKCCSCGACAVDGGHTTLFTEPEKQKKIWWHPHSSADRIGNATNVIFKASERLSLDESKPGAGVLRFDKKRVLTLEGATKATWTMNEVYDENHIYGKRKNNARNPDRGLYYAGIWQELGLKESDACTEWARDILK